MDKFIICRALIYFTAEICVSAGVSHYMENVGLCLCDSKTVLSLKSGDCDEKTYYQHYTLCSPSGDAGLQTHSVFFCFAKGEKYFRRRDELTPGWTR